MGETLLMRQAGEPSVEEILESIKKVIARDSRSEAAQHSAQRDRVVPATPPAAIPRPQAEPVVDESDESVLELTEAESAEPHDHDPFDEDDETMTGEHEPAAKDEEPVKPLVAETAVSSMRESLAALALLSQPGAAPQIVRSGETSLEGLTRDLLRPMLAQWLETHLPAMVEKLVAAEIARIARKQG